MKRCLDIIYEDVHINTHMHVYIYTVEPLNNGHTRSEALVLCREVVFIYYIAVQLSLNQYTKTTVLFKLVA